MNTNEVVAALAQSRNMNKTETRRLLDIILQTFNDNLASGHRFTVPGLGTFSTQTRDERRSYNPHYEQYMMLPPKRVVSFIPSKGLKEDIKQVGLDDE